MAGFAFWVQSIRMIPLPNESQSQFAIRFHSEMAAKIPSTSQRNQAALNAWRNSANHQPFIKSLDSRFPVSQYRRVRNVNCFEEHELPESTLPDGTVSEAKKYSRTELAEMVDGMNSRILDHEHFSPLSKGHTQLDADGNLAVDPEVLGYTGPYYLGQVGEQNPRWAIFEDEYHQLSSVPELDKRRGRSPEVWPYKNARDRFFHPVAALGAEMPRLNLTPARYSRTGNAGERIFVEFYSGTTPYGGNASAPSFGKKESKMPDMYGQSADPNAPAPAAAPVASAPAAQDAPPQNAGGMDDESGAGVPEMVDEIVGALMETPPFQFLMQLYQERQQADAQPPMAGGASPLPGAPAPAPAVAPAAAAPPMAPPAPAAVAPAPAPAPADPNRPQPYSRREIELQEALIRERTGRIRLERYSRLTALASEFDLVPEDEVERTADFNHEQFEGHCQMIQDRYRRNPQSVTDFASLASYADPTPKPARQTAGQLGQKDADEIARIATEKGVSYGVARDMYTRSKSAVAAS